jgi:putative oxidoreductase
MIGATIVAKLPDGFVGGFELELLLMSVAISLLLTGPGKISVEYNILKREIFPKGKKIVDAIRQLQ